jgi:hypothetical protein
VKRDERAAAIERIRQASLAWHEADREIESMTGQRERIQRFVNLALHGGLVGVDSVDDVPTALQPRRSPPGADIFAVRPCLNSEAAERKAVARAAIYTRVPAPRRIPHAPAIGHRVALVFLEATPFLFPFGVRQATLLRYLRATPSHCLSNKQLGLRCS